MATILMTWPLANKFKISRNRFTSVVLEQVHRAVLHGFLSLRWLFGLSLIREPIDLADAR